MSAFGIWWRITCVALAGGATGWLCAHWLGWWGVLISLPIGMTIGSTAGRAIGLSVGGRKR